MANISITVPFSNGQPITKQNEIFVDPNNSNATGPIVAIIQSDGTLLGPGGTPSHVIVDSGSITAVQATGTNLHTVVDSGSVTATQVDPAATTGNITAADVGTSSTTNSIGQTIITGTPTAGSFVTATLSANSGITIMLSGTGNQTLAFERSMDGGTTYIPFSVEETTVGSSVSTITISDNKPYVFRGNVGEMSNVRIRATTVTSGTIAVRLQPGFGISQVIANQGPPNTAANAWQVAVTTAGYTSQPTVTRPANTTPYTAGDVVGGAITFTNAGSGGVIITDIDLRIDITAVPSGMTSFRLHLYNVTPPSAIVDNSPWTFGSGDDASYLGYIDVGTPALLVAGAASLFVETSGINKKILLASTSVFGYLVTNGGFTPAANSEVYTPRLQTVGV